MANELYEAQRELDGLGTSYNSLLQEFRKKGDIDVFADFQNKLLELDNRVRELPASDERFEIICGITILSNAINSLLHSAC